MARVISLLVIQPTPFCNLDCDYCYLPDRRATRRMSPETLDHVARRVFESGLVGPRLSVVWHAGEPLAVPAAFYESAFRIFEARRDGCHITHCMQTNGTLITPAWCDLIAAHRIQVGVSLDGPAFVHDAHRKTRGGAGTHARVMRGVEQLRRHGIPFHVIAVITRISLDYPDEIFGFFREHGMGRIGFNVEETEGIHAASSLAGGDVDGRYRAFMERMYELVRAPGHAVTIREFEWARSAICGETRPPRHGVGAAELNHQTEPFGIVTVDADGGFSTFSPELLGQTSATYGGFTFGNALADPLAAAWANRTFRRVRRDIAAGVARCRRTCEYFDLCGGGAPANKYAEPGSFRASETMYCRYSIQVPIDIVLEDLERGLTPASEEHIHAGLRS
jgi:uncharacterized protein